MNADAGMPALYAELKSIAHRLRARLRPGDTLSTTVVVHEAYARLADRNALQVEDRDHLLALCARAMRFVMIDHLRERGADKRGGWAGWLSVDSTQIADLKDPSAVLALHQSLLQLEALDPRLVRMIELRMFAGLEPPMIAEVLGVNVRTVQRDWQRAHAWLTAELP